MSVIEFEFKDIKRIAANKTRIEKKYGVKLLIYRNKVVIQPLKQDESAWFAEQAIQAIAFGFPFQVASLIGTDIIFKEISLKDLTTRKSRLRTIKSRILGREGRARKILERLSSCRLLIKNNEIGIIGEPEEVALLSHALEKLVRGSSHGSVYSFMERERKKLKARRLIETY